MYEEYLDVAQSGRPSLCRLSKKVVLLWRMFGGATIPRDLCDPCAMDKRTNEQKGGED